MKIHSAALLLSAFIPVIAAAQTPTPQPTPAPAAEAKPAPAPTARSIPDWAELHRYAADNATLPAAPEPNRVVFYGDSITDAWTRNGGTFFPGKPYLNRGISGQTTPQMLVRFRQDVVNLHPAAVVILAGVNDIAGNTGPSTLEMIHDNFRSMVEIATANNIRVLIASVLPAADFPWKPNMNPAPKVIALNKWLADYAAQQHLTYIDYYTPMADPATGGMKPGLSIDGVHPNTAGYAIMQPLAQAAIDKLFPTQ